MNQRVETRGFGVKNKPWQNFFIIDVPTARNGNVVLLEEPGIEDEGEGKRIERCAIPRANWRAVADGVKSYLNKRLKEARLKPANFATGENEIERLLGREIAVLFFALEDASAEEAKIIFASWSSYKKEELWWLFSHIERAGGRADSERQSWRKAMRVILSEKPESTAARAGRKSKATESVRLTFQV